MQQANDKVKNIFYTKLIKLIIPIKKNKTDNL